MQERLFEQARIAFTSANEEAFRRRGEEGEISLADLLIGILKTEATIPASVLIKHGCTLERLRQEVDKRLGNTSFRPGEVKKLPKDPAVSAAIESAKAEAVQVGHDGIRVSSLCIGVLQTPDVVLSEAFQVFGISPEVICAEVREQVWNYFLGCLAGISSRKVMLLVREIARRRDTRNMTQLLEEAAQLLAKAAELPEDWQPPDTETRDWQAKVNI